MGLLGSSYSSVADVLSITKFLMDGQSTFNNTTTPTLTEVEGFIDEASAVLNLALAAEGFTASAILANSTANLACSNWVRGWAASFVSLTSPTLGMGNNSESRVKLLRDMNGSAMEFVDSYVLGFKLLGVTQATTEGTVLVFTGETLQADRADPLDTSLEQSLFKRGQFDNT